MKFIRYSCRFLLIIILTLVTFQFIVNTKFSFPAPVAFSGEKLYNPYLGIDSTKWKRANFHLHTRLLFGLTAGASITNQIADDYYNFFNYDIHNTSDYMRINTFNSENKSYVPVYEHGYSYNKTHQLVLNAKKVFWGDYLFHQTLNNKQYIVDKLKEDTAALVTIVHPFRRKAFSISDFKYLGNYDCLEIVNDNANFSEYYDSALSSGHVVFIMADDDAHSLSSRTNDEKKEAIEKLPVLTKFEIIHDTITVKMNKNVNVIKFIGQNGALKKILFNRNSGSYPFRKEDTYIRSQITCYDGSICFLNPVFRYDGLNLPVNNPHISVLETWAYRLLFAVILLIIIFFSVKYRVCIMGKK